VVIFPGEKKPELQLNELLTIFNTNTATGVDTTKQKISGIDFENKFFADVFRKKEENPVYPEIDGHLHCSQITSHSRNAFAMVSEQ
jgi:hypothetical protein